MFSDFELFWMRSVNGLAEEGELLTVCEETYVTRSYNTYTNRLCIWLSG
jgi:hypothetical protein